MTAILTELATIPAPGMLTRPARGEWGRYTDDPGALYGDSLCHRDPNPTNFIIDGPRAWLVDWGWACRGPAWLTSANLALSLIEAGWNAPDAQSALTGIPAWRDAPPGAIRTHADANLRMWDDAVERAPTKARKFRRDAARAWADHRARLMGTRV